MTEQDVISVLRWSATFLFTSCFVPQIIKILRTGTVAGLSIEMLCIQLAGNVVAFCYASLIGQPPLQIKYVLAFGFLALCIGVYIRAYRRQKKTC